MTVIRALKDDPVGRMHSHHQIDEAQYKAARAFQEAADQATLGAVRRVDWTRTPVSGGTPPDPLPESRQKAMRWVRVAEEAAVRRHGAEGLGLTRAVLCDRQSVEQTARLRGAESDREVWFWSRLFRRRLDVLAYGVRLRDVGISTTAAERARRVGPRRRSGTAGERG